MYIVLLFFLAWIWTVLTVNLNPYTLPIGQRHFRFSAICQQEIKTTKQPTFLLQSRSSDQYYF